MACHNVHIVGFIHSWGDHITSRLSGWNSFFFVFSYETNQIRFCACLYFKKYGCLKNWYSVSYSYNFSCFLWFFLQSRGIWKFESHFFQNLRWFEDLIFWQTNPKKWKSQPVTQQDTHSIHDSFDEQKCEGVGKVFGCFLNHCPYHYSKKKKTKKRQKTIESIRCGAPFKCLRLFYINSHHTSSTVSDHGHLRLHLQHFITFNDHSLTMCQENQPVDIHDFMNYKPKLTN